MSESKTSERRISAVDKRRQALELRRAGVDFRRIADQLGYSGPSGSYKAVMTALQDTLREPAEELRQLERERLDAITLKLWPLVMANPPDMEAIDRLLKVMARRAKLDGLDAPSKHVHGGDKDAPPISHEHHHRLNADEFRQLPLEDRVRYLREQMSLPGRN